MFDYAANVIHAMCGLSYPPPNTFCDNVRPGQKTSSQPLHHEAGQSDVVTDTVTCGHDANGSPVTDELSKDLIEAARDAQGG